MAATGILPAQFTLVPRESPSAVDATWEWIHRNHRREIDAVAGNLVSAAGGRSLKTLLVTSANAGEGKTTAAAFLAHGLAHQARARVIVVDGNLRAPRLHLLFGGRPSPGFSDLLATLDGLEQALQPTPMDNLRLLPGGSRSGTKLPAPDWTAAELLLGELGARADHVIVDGDSVLDSSQTWVLARCFDGVVMVAECDRTRWETLETGRAKVAKAGGRVLGVVLNKRKYYVPEVLYSRL